MTARRLTHFGLVAAGVVLAVVGASACSGGSSDHTSSSDSTAAPAETAPAATTDPPAPPPALPGRLVDNFDASAVATGPASHELSGTQLATIDQFGAPNRFTVQFLTDVGADGSQLLIRHETWYYDEAGTAIVFRNGEVFTERGTGEPLVQPALGSTSYRPEQFVAGMTIDDLLVATGQPGYYAVDEPALGGELLALEGLMAGVNGEGVVVFVEAISLTPAETRSSE